MFNCANIVARGTQLTDHILIGTPATILDWGTKFGFFKLSMVQVFVLDEADIVISENQDSWGRQMLREGK